MVAQLKPLPMRLPLLAEPEPPRDHGRASIGWRRQTGELVRWHADDRQGALVQHAIVRYLVHGVSRAEIARETGYSERQVQSWINGRCWRPYAEPVRAALRSLGIGMTHGMGARAFDAARPREVAVAALAWLETAGWLLKDDERPAAIEAVRMARLLTAGREPLG